jgi:hypothetical protein
MQEWPDCEVQAGIRDSLPNCSSRNSSRRYEALDGTAEEQQGGL